MHKLINLERSNKFSPDGTLDFYFSLIHSKDLSVEHENKYAADKLNYVKGNTEMYVKYSVPQVKQSVL